jgi:hypothetical protein
MGSAGRQDLRQGAQGAEPGDRAIQRLQSRSTARMTPALRCGLMDRLAAGSNTLLVAGEAASHCVGASMDDMLAHLPPERLRQTVLLTDCMSPVGGFEDAADAMLDRGRRHGVRQVAILEV